MINLLYKFLSQILPFKTVLVTNMTLRGCDISEYLTVSLKKIQKIVVQWGQNMSNRLLTGRRTTILRTEVDTRFKNTNSEQGMLKGFNMLLAQDYLENQTVANQHNFRIPVNCIVFFTVNCHKIDSEPCCTFIPLFSSKPLCAAFFFSTLHTE